MDDEEIKQKHEEIREGIRNVGRLTDEITAMIPGMDDRDKQYAEEYL